MRQHHRGAARGEQREQELGRLEIGRELAGALPVTQILHGGALGAGRCHHPPGAEQPGRLHGDLADHPEAASSSTPSPSARRPGIRAPAGSRRSTTPTPRTGGPKYDVSDALRTRDEIT